MGGRGSNFTGSQGATMNAVLSAQPLLESMQNDPTALLYMTDDEALEVVKLIEHQPIATDGTQNDTFIQRYLNATGLSSEKPIVLDEEAFESLRASTGAQTLYHSDRPLNGGGIESTREMLRQFQTGNTAYASTGILGGGTYLDRKATTVASSYGPGGSQIKAFLNDNARVASLQEVQQTEKQFAETHTKTHKYLNSLGRKLGPHGAAELRTVYLTSFGYNAAAFRNGRTVVYSRKALTVCSKIAASSAVTSNW